MAIAYLLSTENRSHSESSYSLIAFQAPCSFTRFRIEICAEKTKLTFMKNSPIGLKEVIEINWQRLGTVTDLVLGVYYIIRQLKPKDSLPRYRNNILSCKSETNIEEQEQHNQLQNRIPVPSHLHISVCVWDLSLHHWAGKKNPTGCARRDRFMWKTTVEKR